MLVFLVIGIITLIFSKAATSTAVVEPENGTKSGNLSFLSSSLASGGRYLKFGQVSNCTDVVTNYAYVRPYSPSAAWNIPACEVPRWSRSDDFSDRLWNYATAFGNKGEWNVEFGLNTSPDDSNDYAVPVFDAADATYQAHVRPKASYNGTINIGADSTPLNDDDWLATIPFNPAWRPAQGNDGIMVIVDKVNGKEWFLWNVAWGSSLDPNSGYHPAYNNTSECQFDANNYNPRSIFFPNGRGFYDVNTDLCVAAAMITKTPTNAIADFRTYAGNLPSASGGGIQNYAGLTMAEEIEAGEIRHALKFVITNTMFGPTCPADVTSPNDARFGTTCGSAVAPAGQFENVGILDGLRPNPNDPPLGPGSTPDERRAGSVPEGTRFALDIDNAYIENWLNSRGYTGQKRQTAKILANAIRDYGLIVTDSSGGGSSIQLEGGTNPATFQKWRNLGINDNGKNLLFGLFTREKLYALEPAVNICANGQSSRFFCHASSTGYPN